jgi:hypothetical protein
MKTKIQQFIFNPKHKFFYEFILFIGMMTLLIDVFFPNYIPAIYSFISSCATVISASILMLIKVIKINLNF